MTVYISVRWDGEGKWWKLYLISGMLNMVKGLCKVQKYPIDETQYCAFKIVSDLHLPICCMTIQIVNLLLQMLNTSEVYNPFLLQYTKCSIIV
jgi:hypothetical protein